MQAIVSSAIWGAAIGATAGGALSDRLGRRATLRIAAALFIIASLLMALAPSPSALIIGRSLVGLAIGAASIVVPVFIAESVPTSVRAALVSANVLMITGGQFASYLVNWALSAVPEGAWRWMLAAAAAPAALQLAGLLYIPETPHWLMSKVCRSSCAYWHGKICSMLRWTDIFGSNAHKARENGYAGTRRSCRACDLQLVPRQ